MVHHSFIHDHSHSPRFKLERNHNNFFTKSPFLILVPKISILNKEHVLKERKSRLLND